MNPNYNQSVTAVKGIGEETAVSLAEMNIVSVKDLLEYFPYRYEDYRLKDLEEIKHDERVTVEGKVHSEPSLSYYGRKRSRLTVRVLVGRYLIQVVMFNQPYLKNKITLNETVTVTGKWDQHRQIITANELKIGNASNNKDFEPVYAVKGNISVKGIRRYIKLAFSQYGNEISETLPEKYLLQYRLLNRRDAMRSLHFPANDQELKQGEDVLFMKNSSIFN